MIPMRTTGRRRSRSAWIGVLTLLTVACGADGASASATIVRDSSGITILEHDLTRLAATCTLGDSPTLSIGVEEGDEAYMLAQVGGAIRLDDGRIVLANRQSDEIRYYDSTGTWIRSSGRRGQGPGEFSEPFYIQPLRGDTIYVGDFRPFQFLVFDEKGDWVRTVRPDPMEVNTPRSMNILADGRLVLGREDAASFRELAPFAPRMMTMEVYDRAGKLTDTLLTVENGRYGRMSDDRNAMFIFPLFESFAQVAARKDRIVSGHASRAELQVRSDAPGLPVERIIRWNAGPRAISPADIAAYRAATLKQYATIPPEMREQMVEPLITEKRPVADSFPAFGQLRLAHDGAIWIREFPHPTDTVAHHWIAFERDGRFRCRLDTRRFDEYLDWGSTYLLVLDPDSNDVERVRQFPLRAP